MTAAAGVPPVVHPVDERLPWRRLVPLSVQHVLAMIATPVSTTFLTGQAIGLSAGRTAALLSATLILCGAGALLQSFGVRGVGARLPFVMLPGGAAAALFLQIARAHGAATASGSVLLAAALLIAVVPLYRRIVPLFPPLVLGTTVLLIGVSMIRVAAQLITGTGAQAVRPAPSAVVLAGVTVASTVLCFLLLRGAWRQSAVLIGMAAGAVIAVTTGLGSFASSGGHGSALPSPLPFGAPRFDLLAALPLLVFALSSLAEATGQTVLNSEAVGRVPDAARDVPRVVRADALVSLVGALFGTSLLVTSSENIGIVHLTGVRSRFVTAGAGVLLIVTGLVAPLSRLLAGIPQPVVGGSALVIYSAITVMGIRMLQRADLAGRGESAVAALALVAGLLPVVVPTLYLGFPGWVQTVLGSGVVAGTLTGVVLHALFQSFPSARGRASSSA
ncbi:purine/pyrimidine permease [Streptomyces sp. RB6PN25]|uniref:Purine/pyrimidine permease n=1 Tax=Streptomyces humicola TaxID=2953240 RepID=A0ABT1PYB5_9ACTN|nr:solute carrier family 23 protein [Streptomyces humicola]MCQ4082668.1 purine/pyrimidine permease [Streptomyces humicola]